MLTAKSQRELLQNLPAPIRNRGRYFAVSKNKVPKQHGWALRENQRAIAEIPGSLVGFDVVGHGVDDDYLFLDFDHVLKRGNFVNEAARAFCDKIFMQFPQIYCEVSISGTGLHMFMLPTAGKYPPISASVNRGTLQFDETSKLEVFYATGGRYCLVTGDYYPKRYDVVDGTKRASKKYYEGIIPSGAEVDAFIETELLPLINVTVEDKIFTAARAPQATVTTELRSENSQSDIVTPVAEAEVDNSRSSDETPAADIDTELISILPKQRTIDTQLLKWAFAQNSAFAEMTATAPDTLRAMGMLAKIPVAELTYQDWIAVGMILKNNGNTLEDWLKWSRNDARYVEGECSSKWDSFTGGDLTIATLHQLAKLHGYTEGDFQKQWRKSLTIPPEIYLTPDQRNVVFWGIAGTSDLANAYRITYLCGKELRYVRDIDGWMNYSNGTWIINSNTKNSALNEPVEKVAKILSSNARTEAEKQIAECFVKQRKIGPAITMLRGTARISIKLADLDKHKNLLNCENCVVDLETGKMYQHAPELLLTQQCKASYRPNYCNETVMKFLQAIQPNDETRAALLRFLGYSITGECNEEKFLFVDGTGGNGKSTLLKSILYIIDNYGCNFPIEGILLHKSIDPNAATPAFNVLEHKRLAISEEIPQGARLNASKVKQLTGGDMIYIRHLHHEATRIDDPTHTMIFSGNYLPEIGDVRDPGILRRLLRIQFTQDFTQAPDVTLKFKLLTEDCRAGLLTLLVENATAWYKQGLIISSEMEQSAKAYTDSQDFIAEFISEHCIKTAGASIPRKEFLSKLIETYPVETRGFSERALTAMIEKQDGIGYGRFAANGGFAFRGVGWLNQS